MVRDEQIEIITAHLNQMIYDEDRKPIYDAIMAIANHKMNLELYADDKGNHHLLWRNNKVKGEGSFSKDVEQLLHYLNTLDNN